MAEQIIWRLRIGTRLTGFTVEPDDKYPGVMWRIHAPNGKISDMVNLSRAKDAALAHARKIGTLNSSHEIITWEKRPKSVADGEIIEPGLPGLPEGT